MNNEEYEVLPHQLLTDLRYDVEALKKKLSAPDTKINEALLEMESLKDSLHDLTTIFQKALETSKDEDPAQKIQKLQEVIEEVVNQNETIAKGMIAISEKLENFMNAQSITQGTKPTITATSLASGSMPPLQHTMGLPSLPGSRIAPLPTAEGNFPPSMSAVSDMDLPPPPPRMKGKRSLGGMF